MPSATSVCDAKSSPPACPSMQKRDAATLLEDIEQHALAASRFVSGVTLEQYRNDLIMCFAVERALETAGEALKLRLDGRAGQTALWRGRQRRLPKATGCAGLSRGRSRAGSLAPAAWARPPGGLRVAVRRAKPVRAGVAQTKWCRRSTLAIAAVVSKSDRDGTAPNPSRAPRWSRFARSPTSRARCQAMGMQGTHRVPPTAVGKHL